MRTHKTSGMGEWLLGPFQHVHLVIFSFLEHIILELINSSYSGSFQTLSITLSRLFLHITSIAACSTNQSSKGILEVRYVKEHWCGIVVRLWVCVGNVMSLIPQLAKTFYMTFERARGDFRACHVSASHWSHLNALDQIMCQHLSQPD